MLLEEKCCNNSYLGREQLCLALEREVSFYSKSLIGCVCLYIEAIPCLIEEWLDL